MSIYLDGKKVNYLLDESVDESLHIYFSKALDCLYEQTFSIYANLK